LKEKSETKRDVTALEVIRRWKFGTEADATVYLFSVTGDERVERRNYLTEFHYTRNVKAVTWTDGSVMFPARKTGDYVYSRHTETRQKFLCIGGPLAGKRVTEQEAQGYHAYNAAGRSVKKECRVLLVWI